jgi:hypothetical protein
MATQNLLLDPLPTSTITGVGMPTSPDYVLPDDVVATENTEKDLLSYFNSKEASSITNLTKDQKDAAVSGFRDFVRITAESNADPGMVLPEKFEIPAYSEYNGPIFEAQFPAIKTPDDLINFGMLDENGPTDKGRLMIDLKKIGGLNRDYTLNLTGKALLSDQAESLKLENLPIFMERKRLKLDDPEEKSWGTIWDEFTGVLKSTYEMGMAISPTMIAASLYNQDDKAKEVLSAERNAMIEAGVSGIVKFQNTLASGASTIARGLLIRATEEGKQQDIELAALDQNFKRNQFQQQAFKSSEALHEITGLTNWVDQMANAKEQLGEAGFQKAQETGEVGGQMLFSIINPLAPENVAFNLGMKATIAPFKVAGAMVGTARKTSEVFAEASSNLEAININLAKTQAAGQAATKYSASLQTAAERLTAEGNIAAAKSVGKQIVKSNNIAQKAVFQAEQWTKLAGEASQKVDFLAPSAARANKIIKVADISAQFPKLITTPVGFTLQKVGRGMIKIDAGLEAASQKMGAGKFYNAMTKWSSMAGIGTFGAVSGLPPSMAWFPAAFKLAWSTAPVIEAAGDFVRVVGREASAARGAIPMWRKIGRMQNAGPAHRMIAGFMDVATLGGFPVAQNAIKGTVAATAASVPLDLALSYVTSGGETNPNAPRESIVGNAFFAGGGATLGAIQMGSKGTLKKLQIGDVLNFRRSIADPQQRMMFDAMPRGYRDAIGSYSGSKPNTRIEFVKEGGGHHDPSTNTIRINPNAKNPLRPLIAHEVLEAMVAQSNMGEAIRTLLVGDGVQTGGLLRDRNGNLDPKFIEFRDRYNQLRQAEVNRINQTRPPENRELFTPLNDREMAKEYFIEMNADDMAGLAESGQLGKLAARSAASRKMIDLGNTILNKSSILRNLHFNLGGVMDSGGKMVMGNGLLADGIRQLPEAKAMFQKMVRDTAGRPQAVKMTAAKSKGSVIPTSGMDDPLWSEMIAYWKTDQAGVPIKDKSGNWVPLERHVEQAREQAGLLIQADQKQRIAAGETIPKHEIQYSPETGWRGKYFSAAQIEIIKNSGYFNDSQIRLFEHVNNAAKRGKGERFLMIYNPATSSRLRGRGSKRYETLGPTMKEGGVLGFSMGQKGQLLIDIIDTQQLHQNVMEQAGKKIGQKLYKGNIDKILTDINAVMELHGKGESADIHFKQEYGVDWKAHKDFINSTFGDISGGAKARPADYMMINPVLVTDRPTNAVFKTYRLDRLNKATAMEGTTGIPMDYNMVKANFMPDGVPLFTGDGEPVDLRYTAVEDENGLRAVPGANYGKKNGMPVEDAGGMPVEQTAPVIKGDEKLWDSPPQNITSADTSINDKKTAATFTKVNFEEGTINADIGGGRFDNATSILKDKGVTNIIFDPFNRTEAHNTDAANKIKDGQADTTTVNNVLNVIQEAGNRDKVIRQAANAVKPNGTSYFLLYEGNGSGVGRETSKGWQENRKTKDYLNEIGAHYDDVKVRNGIIEAKNPIKNISPDMPEGEASQSKQNVLAASSPEWKAMSMDEKTNYVFQPEEMTPKEQKQFDDRVENGLLTPDVPVVSFDKSKLLTSRYGPPNSAALETINIWIDEANGKPVAVAFRKDNTNIGTIANRKQYMPEVSSKESGKPIDLMAYTSVGGDPDMIMSAKWGRTVSGINPETGKKQAAQTSAIVANSPNPEDHQVGFKRIDSLLKASDLDPAQKKALENFVIKTAGFAVDSPGFRDLPMPKTLTEARDTIAKVKDRMAKNLLSIYDAVPPPVRNYWQRWYPLAYDWNNAQSKVHSIPAPAIAGINARLSPGKDWIHNVNMTERILSAFTNGISMTSEIAAGAVPLIDAALDTKLNQKDNRGKPQEWKQDLIDKANKAKKEINAMVGMNIVDMNSKQAARLIRFHTQVVGENRVLNYFEKGNPVYADGISWQSTVNIEKAINIYLDPTIENISANMGDDHKIRSFYNNQVAPHDPTLRDVTSDTHAVAATYLLPLSQSSLQVSRNFGTTSNSVAGMSGMYYIVADAYRMAADARGVEPRAMQSITWEGVRSMYPRGFKNNKANIKKVEAIWNRVETKQISKQQALREINGLMIDFFSKNPDSRPRVTVLPTQ